MKAWQAMGFLAALALPPRALADERSEAVAATGAPGAESPAAADSAASSQRIEDLQKRIQELERRLDQMAAQEPAERAPAKPGSGAGAAAGSIEFYGHLDLSIDVGTKGLAGRSQANGDVAVGDQDWLPAIASNLSFVGVRGGRDLLPDTLRGVFQIEAQVDASATPGPTSDAQVKGALAARNTFVGLTGPWGGLKVGKHDSPYKSSTRRLDPFYGTVGTYTSVMHNTGGDNRAEFDQRFSHAVWYESPALAELVSFKILFSPGQNRSQDNVEKAYSEPICTGGNDPPCNDGAYGSAYSASVQLERGPFYATAAWELHHSVNRTGDEDGGLPLVGVPFGAVGVANEWAVQVAAQYTLPSETTIGAIFEKLGRHNHYINQDYNERDRVGWWVMATQKLGSENALSVGWAHAGSTPGDVGTRRSDGTTATGPVDNQTNMITGGVWHYFADGKTSAYLAYAAQVNHNGAHYDLGAVSHGIAYDGKDGEGKTFAGSTIQAATVGMTYNF